MFQKTGDAQVIGDPLPVEKKDREEDKTKKIKKDKKEEKEEK